MQFRLESIWDWYSSQGVGLILGVVLGGRPRSHVGQFDWAILDTYGYMICVHVVLKQEVNWILDEIKVTACLSGTVIGWLCVIMCPFFIIANKFAIAFKVSAGAWGHDNSCSAVLWVHPICSICGFLTNGYNIVSQAAYFLPLWTHDQQVYKDWPRWATKQRYWCCLSCTLSLALCASD